MALDVLDRQMNEQAKEMAMQTRINLGYSLIEPIDIFKVITRYGMSCIKKPMESNISGMIIKSDRTTLILINTNRTVGHQIFTGGHELYHALYDEGMEGRSCITGIYDLENKNESMADYFSANFLIPDEGVKHHLNMRVGQRNASLEDAVYLGQYFGVSHKAMLKKLLMLGRISENDYNIFLPDITIKAKLYGYSTRLYTKTKEEEVISDYAEKAFKALEKGLITDSRYEELLFEAGIYEQVMGIQDVAGDNTDVE